MRWSVVLFNFNTFFLFNENRNAHLWRRLCAITIIVGELNAFICRRLIIFESSNCEPACMNEMISNFSQIFLKFFVASSTEGFLMCFIIGVAGYCSFGVNTQGVILSNFTGHYADPFRILLIVHLIL